MAPLPSRTMASHSCCELETAVEELLTGQRRDRVLDLERVVVDRHAQSLGPVGLIDETDRERIGDLRIQVRIAAGEQRRRHVGVGPGIEHDVDGLAVPREQLVDARRADVA
jgi:hypothetical protein